MPKRVKYRKAQRGRMRGKAQRGSTLAFGEYGLKALEPGWVTNRQIEAARVALSRSLKRGGKIWIRIFPDKPVTKKPAETRMGKGKGNPEEWVAVVKPGRIIYEMQGVPEDVAREAFRTAAQKMAIATKFVMRTRVLRWPGERGERDEGEQVARSLGRGARAEGARARRGDLQSTVPALDGSGQEPVTPLPGAEGPRASLHGAPREEGVAAWVSARPAKGLW